MGRPSSYSAEMVVEICSRIAEGQSVRAICTDEQMPDMRTIFRWLDAHEDFRQQYARARDMQADTLADEILHIADNTQSGIKTKTTNKGVEIMEGDMIEHRRLQVDARKWIASKLKPKKYGDKVTHSGDPDAPVALNLFGSDIHG